MMEWTKKKGRKVFEKGSLWVDEESKEKRSILLLFLERDVLAVVLC